MNYLLEVKDGSKEPARRRLSEDEQAWHSAWGGIVTVKDVRSNGFVVNFISSYKGVDDYSLYCRTTGETARIHYMAGKFSTTTREVTAAEQDAVLTFIAARDAEYRAWAETHKSAFV